MLLCTHAVAQGIFKCREEHRKGGARPVSLWRDTGLDEAGTPGSLGLTRNLRRLRRGGCQLGREILAWAKPVYDAWREGTT